jgi:hypothetical protein
MKVLRIIWICTLLLMMLPEPTRAAQKPTPIQVYLDGVLFEFADAEPFLENGTTYVPFRPIFEGMGLSVAWDGTRKTITGIQAGLSIQLTLSQNTAVINGVTQTLEAHPKLVKGTTYIPLRFIAEATGKTVTWDGGSRTIYIVTPSSELSLKQWLEPLEIQELGRFEVYSVGDLSQTTVAFQLNTQAFTSMNHSNELRQAVTKLMRQIQDVPHYMFTHPSAITKFRLLVLWGAHPIYDWEYTKSDNVEDPGVYDADSDMRVSIHSDRGVVLQYKVKGIWDELPVLGPNRLTEDELGILQLHKNYYEALNTANADMYLDLLHEGLKSTEVVEQVRKDIRSLTGTFQPAALQILDSDPRSNTMIVRSVEYIYSNDLNDLTERSTYMLVSQSMDGIWRLESLKTDTIEYNSVIQKHGSYHIAKNAPYHELYPQGTIPDKLKSELADVIARQVSEHPMVSFSWGPEDIHFLREEQDTLYIAAQLFHSSAESQEQAATDDSYTQDVIYVLKRSIQGQWIIHDMLTTKINYSFQWLSWTME